MYESKIFKRFISRYLLVGIFILLGCLPFAFMSYKYIRDYSINENSLRFSKGIAALTASMEKMDLIATMLGDDQSMLTLEQVEGRIPDDRILFLKYLNRKMFDYSCLFDFSSLFFSLYRYNDAFVSHGQVSRSFSDYYGQFFRADDYTSGDLRNILINDEGAVSLVPVGEISYVQGEKTVQSRNVLLYSVPIMIKNGSSPPKAVLVFILEEQDMLKVLLGNSDPGEMHVALRDRDGRRIISYGSRLDLPEAPSGHGEMVRLANRTYRIVSHPLGRMGMTVSLGIPMTLIERQIRGILTLLAIYALIGISIALFLSVAFSVHWFGPVRRMFRAIPGFESIGEKRENEFDLIRESLDNLRTSRDELEARMLLADAQKQAILLENTFIKGFYRKKDEQLFLDTFPHISRGYRVIYLQVQWQGEEEQEALPKVMERLENVFSGGCVHVRSMMDTEILLIPDEGDWEEGSLREVLLSAGEFLKGEYDLNYYIGISLREKDVCNINVAYYQARQTVHGYKYMNESFVEFYQYLLSGRDGVFQMGFIGKLNDMILSAGKDEIGKIFDDFRKECREHKEMYEIHKGEIYHIIRFTVYAAYQQLPFLSADQIPVSEFQQNQSLLQCLDSLQASILEICDSIINHRRSRKTELRDRILDFLADNFGRPDLTADVVGKEMGVTEKYLMSYIKEQTGKTFFHLLNEMRIEAAKGYLINTDWTNEKVAERTGYGSMNSYYRAFRKYVGVTPNIYKNREARPE